MGKHCAYGFWGSDTLAHHRRRRRFSQYRYAPAADKGGVPSAEHYRHDRKTTSFRLLLLHFILSECHHSALMAVAGGVTPRWRQGFSRRSATVWRQEAMNSSARNIAAKLLLPSGRLALPPPCYFIHYALLFDYLLSSLGLIHARKKRGH